MLKVFRAFYMVRFYFNIIVAEISWISGKFPELMAVVYLAEKMGLTITKQGIITFTLLGFVSLVLLGVLWKHTGIYDVSMYVGARMDPVQKELLEAARRINKNDKSDKTLLQDLVQ